MIYYQVMVEGVFVRLDNDSKKIGFHSTFYVRANSAKNAVHKTRELISMRMLSHHVAEVHSSRIFRSHYLVHDLWEVTEHKFKESEGRDTGFTFFRIGPLEKIQLAFRHAFLNRAKPWRLIKLQA